MSQIDDPKNPLSRRGLLCGAATLAASTLLTECGFNASSGKNSAEGFDPVGAHPGTLTVSANIAGAIPARFLGLSYEKTAMSYSYFHPSNRNLIALFRLLGKGVLRIGGGSVDEVAFVTQGKGTHLQVTTADILALAGFLEQTGWLCLYGVNLATSTPALAAAEAAYAVSALGPNLLGIEIGNEPDEYSISGHFFVGNWNFADFIARWESFRAAIVAASPQVAITGPAAGGGNHIATWTLPFGQSTGPSQITLLTQHYYRASGGSPGSTAAFLISADTQLGNDLAMLNAGARQLDIAYRLSECNSFYNGGAEGVSNSYASSLWVLDFLFMAAANNASGVNLHGGGEQPGYTPIADDSGGVIEVRPEYYGLLLFSMAGSGDLLETRLLAGTVDATAYAVKAASGGLNLVIVNKDTAQSLYLKIEANQKIQTATMEIMTGTGLAATSGITIQNATVSKDGTFNPGAPIPLVPIADFTTCFIPPLTAALVRIT